MVLGKLAGKSVLVTGAGSGIGEAIALLFAREGASVAVADFDAQAGQRTAQQIQSEGGAARFVLADVSQAAAAERMVSQTVECFGGIDVLCNNAGIGVAATCHETSEADWDRTMAVDLKGVFLGCKYALPHMLRQGRGVICNTSSVAASQSGAWAGRRRSRRRRSTCAATRASTSPAPAW